MFKIGDFSKLSRVPVKTLRYYDELGLLRAAHVDDFTGYRYYTLDQLPRLNRILALKDLGFSLEQIGRLLEAGLPPGEMRELLRVKRAEIQQRVRDEQARLARVEARLRQIEGDVMPSYDVALRTVGPQRVAAIRAVIPSYDDLGALFGEIAGYVGRPGVRAGMWLALWHDAEYRERDVDAEAAVAIDGALPGSQRVRVYELPRAEMACVVHRGGYDTLGPAYAELFRWMAANGYRLAGPNREVYLRGPQAERDPAAFVTEVQFPVVRGEQPAMPRAPVAGEAPLMSHRAREALDAAVEAARRRGDALAGAGHLLLGLALTSGGFAGHVLRDTGVTPELARELLGPAEVGVAGDARPELAEDARQALERAADEARRLGHDYVGTEHMLLALAAGGLIDAALARAGATAGEVRTLVMRMLTRAR